MKSDSNLDLLINFFQVYMLVNNAGTSIPRRFVEADLSESRSIPQDFIFARKLARKFARDVKLKIG